MQRSLDNDTVHFGIQEVFLSSYNSCLLRLDIQMVAGLAWVRGFRAAEPGQTIP